MPSPCQGDNEQHTDTPCEASDTGCLPALSARLCVAPRRLCSGTASPHRPFKLLEAKISPRPAGPTPAAAAPTPHGGSSSSSGGSRMSFGATAGEAGTANKHSTDVQSTNRAGASALAFTPKVPVGHALISVRLLVLRDPAARACPTASPAPSTAATASWCRPPRTR